MDTVNRPVVIVPCHNEAATVRAVLESIRSAVPDADVLVVDDGSTDATALEVQSVPGVRLHRLSHNRGKGVALREGVRLSAGDPIVFLDADGQDDPFEIPKLLDRCDAAHPFVNGSKFIGFMEPGAISRPNFHGNRFMTLAIRVCFGGRVTDSQSGFRAMRRSLIAGWTLVSTSYEIETEMLCKALKDGVAVVEVPVTRKARGGGVSGFKRVRNGLRILRTILVERFRR